MFKCESCGGQVKPGISPIMVVTQTRPKVYPVRYKNPQHPRYDEIIDRGGSGFETVKELRTCGCLNRT